MKAEREKIGIDTSIYAYSTQTSIQTTIIGQICDEKEVREKKRKQTECSQSCAKVGSSWRAK